MNIRKTVGLVVVLLVGAVVAFYASVRDRSRSVVLADRTEYFNSRVVRTYPPPVDGAEMVFVNANYLLWQTRAVVEGTESHVKSAWTHGYFLQKVDDGTWRSAPYTYQSTKTKQPLWVFEDGTTVFWRQYPEAFIFAPPEGAAREQLVADIKLPGADDAPCPLVAGKWGVLAQPYNLNNEEPLFLVSWSAQRDSVDFTRARKIVRGERFSVNSYCDDFGGVVGDRIVLWKTPKLYAYDAATDKTASVSLSPGRRTWWLPHLSAADRRYCVVENGSTTILYDFEEGRERTIDIPGALLTVREGRCYSSRDERDYQHRTQEHVLEETLLATGERKVLASKTTKMTGSSRAPQLRACERINTSPTQPRERRFGT